MAGVPVMPRPARHAAEIGMSCRGFPTGPPPRGGRHSAHKARFVRPSVRRRYWLAGVTLAPLGGVRGAVTAENGAFSALVAWERWRPGADDCPPAQ